MNEIELFLKECQDRVKNKEKLAFLDELNKKFYYITKFEFIGTDEYFNSYVGFPIFEIKTHISVMSINFSDVFNPHKDISMSCSDLELDKDN
jgi:hypothetical protein